jgi:dienelactone hydrolase
MRRTAAAGAFRAVPLAAACSALLVAGGCAVRVPHTLTVTIHASGATLKGAVYMPAGRGPHPGIVLVQGASLTSYRDLADVARFFATRGVAAMTYDPRGTGGSTGDRASARLEHLAHDALAAVRFLRARADVDSSRVGLYGFGEEGWVASLAASLDPKASCLALVSAPIVTPLDHAAHRRRDALVAGGMEPEEADALVRMRRRIWEYWLAPAGSGTEASDSLRGAFDKVRKQPWFAPAVEARDLPERLPPDEGMGLENHPARNRGGTSPAIVASLRQDPLAALERVAVPILAVYGEDDREVPVRESERRLRRLGAGDSGARSGRVTVMIFPEADHALRVTKGRGLLRKIEAVPGYEDSLIAWVRRAAAAPPRLAPERPAAIPTAPEPPAKPRIAPKRAVKSETPSETPAAPSDTSENRKESPAAPVAPGVPEAPPPTAPPADSSDRSSRPRRRRSGALPPRAPRPRRRAGASPRPTAAPSACPIRVRGGCEAPSDRPCRTEAASP